MLVYLYHRGYLAPASQYTTLMPESTPEQLDHLESQLQAYLAQPPFWLRFPADIDRRFEDLGRPIRLTRFLKAGWLALLFFDLLAINDYFTEPGSFQIAWMVRFLLVTPLSVAVLLLMPGKWMARWQGWALASLLVFAAGGLSLIALYSDHLRSDYYHFQWLLLVLTGNLLFRFRFRIALQISVLLFLVYAPTVILLVEDSVPDAINAILLMGVVTLISLIAKHRMELDNRITYSLKTLQKIAQYRLKQANKALAKQASRDGLTGIYNRRTLDENYPKLWRHAQRKRRPISILFIDVDYFKRYNDTYGHAAGDECLCWLAGLLQNAARRPLDFAARFGGEEFCIVLPDTQPEEAGIVAEQLRARVLSAQRAHTGNPEGCITVSIGVAGGIPENGQAATFYIDQADKALYAAKTQGRNRVRYGRDIPNG